MFPVLIMMRCMDRQEAAGSMAAEKGITMKAAAAPAVPAMMTAIPAVIMPDTFCRQDRILL